MADLTPREMLEALRKEYGVTMSNLLIDAVRAADKVGILEAIRTTYRLMPMEKAS